MSMDKRHPEQDEPTWTKDREARSLRFSDLSMEMQTKLRRGERGPQKLPTKEKVSIRLSPDVLFALRATGKGWQAKADDVLRTWAKRQKKPSGAGVA